MEPLPNRLFPSAGEGVEGRPVFTALQLVFSVAGTSPAIVNECSFVVRQFPRAAYHSLRWVGCPVSLGRCLAGARLRVAGLAPGIAWRGAFSYLLPTPPPRPGLAVQPEVHLNAWGGVAAAGESWGCSSQL